MIYLLKALGLLIQVFFGAIATLFLLRFLAEACRADFQNPISQFVYRYTNPVLAPIRRVLPNWRRINFAALLVLFLTLLIERVLLTVIARDNEHVIGLLVLSIADVLDFMCLFYIAVIFVWSLASMLGADSYNPIIRLASAIVQPVLRPLRGKLVLGNLDFSPAVVMLVLMLARLLIIQPIFDIGVRLARGG
jgi:YggT family protein